MGLFGLARTFAGLSILAVGGANAAVPEIRKIVVEQRHWMSDFSFSHLFAISQAAPGPNILLVSLIGWRLSGLLGLAVCTLAMNLPSSLLAFVAGRAWAHWSDLRLVGLLRRAIAPVAVGLIGASGVVMGKASDHGGLGLAISLAAGALVVFSRLNLLWALGAAALAAFAAGRLGLRV